MDFSNAIIKISDIAIKIQEFVNKIKAIYNKYAEKINGYIDEYTKAINRLMELGETAIDWVSMKIAKVTKKIQDAVDSVLERVNILINQIKVWYDKTINKIKIPITLLCVRGNHEARPGNYTSTCFTIMEEDPIVPSGYYFEPEFPDIWYASDGATFNINGKRCLFIGGAYSIDKEYRIMMGWRWFADEELTDEEMNDILDKVDHKHFDYVFTHTCPEAWQPYDLFLSFVDQSKVSKRMEEFFTTVAGIIDFDHWYFGHFHAHRPGMEIDKTHPGQGQVSMLFDHVELLMSEENEND